MAIFWFILHILFFYAILDNTKFIFKLFLFFLIIIFYLNIENKLDSLIYLDFFNNFEGYNFEKLFYLISKFFYFVTRDNYLTFYLWWVFILINMTLIIQNLFEYKINLKIILFITLSSAFFLITQINLRQGISLCIGILAITYFFKKKYLIFLILFISTYFLHSANFFINLVIISICIINFYFMKKNKILINLISLFFGTLISILISSLIDNHFTNLDYFTENRVNPFIKVTFILFYIIISNIFLRLLDDKNDNFLFFCNLRNNFFFFSFPFIFLGEVFTRVYFVVYIFDFIIISYILTKKLNLNVFINIFFHILTMSIIPNIIRYLI